MASKTSIQWTQMEGYQGMSWNPTRGCTKVSPGCDNCYAMAVAGGIAKKAYEGLTRTIGERPQWNGKVRLIPHLFDQPLRWTKPRMIFVNSMSDLFHELVPDEVLSRLWAVMQTAHQHIFQVLTKRPIRMQQWCSRPHRAIARNIWLGVSVEDQPTADERLPELSDTPAAINWISVEPLLAPVDVREWLAFGTIDWVVVGGESGPRARPCDPAWIEDIINQCRQYNVPVFVKQLGSNVTGPAWCTYLVHSKGGDISEWPARFQIREYPRAA